jgi:hypothetical protein
MVDPQPSSGLTLTPGPKAFPPAEKPPHEPPYPPLPPKNHEAKGRENPNKSTPSGATGLKQEQTLVTSLDEAHAPFKYATKGNFDYNGIFTDAEDPKSLFSNSAMLIISTLQGGPDAPLDPTPNLLGATDWADLSCALLAAIGRGYNLQYDKDQAAAALKKEWTDAPDPNPLSPKYPTLFHRLSATADSLNDQLLIDCQDGESNIDGWIIEAKTSILRAETESIKAQVKEDWRQWRTEKVSSLAAAQEREIAEAVQKRNASYLLKAAAELGLHLAPPLASSPLLQTMPRGVKRTVSGSAPSTEPTTPRKQKVNPPRDAKRAPSPVDTPRGRSANPPGQAGPPRWVDPSPTPQPKKKDPPGPNAVLNLSPRVTLNLGPKVNTPQAGGTGQLDAAAILAAIKQAMAPIATRLAALERSAMPPPADKVGPYYNHGEQMDHRGQAPPQPAPPNPPTQADEDFTTVSRNGKGRRSRGKVSAAGQAPEQTQQTNPAPASYAGAAAAATNIPQPQTQRKGGPPPPTITEVTVLRAGGLTDSQKETQIQNRAADAIVREVRLKMTKVTNNPIRLRAGRWSINPRSKGNFVYSFDGNVPFDIIKSYEYILLAPLGGVGELCPSMGWTRFLANGVPTWEEDQATPFSMDALLGEVRTLPGLKKAYFAMQPRWLIHPECIHTDYSSVTFAVSDPDGSISATLINSRAALFGKEVTIRKWIDKPAFIQCSRCHTLGHNKASRVCTLSKDSVRCHKCGGTHSSEEHDKRCPKKHQVAGICDCKHKCLNCHNYGHDCRDPRCPARDQYRPRNARKPRKGKDKVRAPEPENNPYDLGYNQWGPEEDWNDEVPGHKFSNFPDDPTQLAPTVLAPPATTPPHTPAPPTASAPTPTSPAGSQIMNIDYDIVDPFTLRPPIYDDPFAGGEVPTPVTYSPSRLNEATTPLNHV